MRNFTPLGGIFRTLLRCLLNLACNFFIFGPFLAIIGPFGSFRTSIGPQTTHIWVLLAVSNDARHIQYTLGTNHPEKLAAGGQYPYENDDFSVGKAFFLGKNGPILIFKKVQLAPDNFLFIDAKTNSLTLIL